MSAVLELLASAVKLALLSSTSEVALPSFLGDNFWLVCIPLRMSAFIHFIHSTSVFYDVFLVRVAELFKKQSTPCSEH